MIYHQLVNMIKKIKINLAHISFLSIWSISPSHYRKAERKKKTKERKREWSLPRTGEKLLCLYWQLRQQFYCFFLATAFSNPLILARFHQHAHYKNVIVLSEKIDISMFILPNLESKYSSVWKSGGGNRTRVRIAGTDSFVLKLVFYLLQITRAT